MSDRQTISAVAARTGFTASALRFYESAGLITPARSEAGYRIYDDRSVERLRFISRAKQLGLSLDEITELVVLWDGDRCAPVAGRLRELVASKLDETRERIAALAALADDLQRFTADLAADPSDGPCDDDCACQPTARTAVAVPISAKSTPSEVPPIACALAPEMVAQRIDDWRSLLASASHRHEFDGGVMVRFPPGPERAAEIGALAAAEQSCCSFFTFTLRIDHAATDLTITTAPDAKPLVDALFGASA